MTTDKLQNVVQTLEQEEQLQSLQYIANRLPQITSFMQTVEGQLSFLTSSLQDAQSLGVIVEGIEKKVEQLHINKEHLDAVLTITHLLPRLVPVIDQVDKIASFAQSVFTDERTVDQFITTTTETAYEWLPIEEGKQVLEETQAAFETRKNQADISVFGLMKMLKEPVVQDALKYADSFISVMNKRRG